MIRKTFCYLAVAIGRSLFTLPPLISIRVLGFRKSIGRTTLSSCGKAVHGGNDLDVQISRWKLVFLKSTLRQFSPACGKRAVPAVFVTQTSLNTKMF